MKLLAEMENWQADLEELGHEKGKAEGRYEQAVTNLKNMGFETLEDAYAERDKRVAKREQLIKDAEAVLAELKEKYANHIE